MTRSYGHKTVDHEFRTRICTTKSSKSERCI